jgi:hypothetical protein
MNTFTKTAVLAAVAAALGAPGARAAYLANDLVLGFDRVDNGGTGAQPADYVINLGNYQTAVGVGGSTVVDLTGLFSAGTFSGLYGSLGSGVTMSVVGGNGATAGRSIFATVARGGLGTPDQAGSLAPGALSSTLMANGANTIGALCGPSGLNLGAGQSTTIAQGDPNSFHSWVLSTTPPSYYSGTGIDPSGSTGGSVLYEDLYRAANNVNGNNFTYLGYFTLDMGGTPSLTFTTASVPEPASGSLLVGGGLLLLWLRRFTKTNQG